MFTQIGKNLWVTKIFFLVRFAAALIISIVYIILAAAIQSIFVKWFGENTFNYILGGIMSLILGAMICNYLGRLLFMFVRGWHIAALAYARKIQAKNLPALDAGMRVFSKHFISFAVVYGAGMLLGRFAEEGSEKLWDMLEDVPYLGSLSKVANNPLVKHVAKDLLDTGFDAVIFYIVRHTKPGLEGDLEAVPLALRKYLYALPNIMGASLLAYLLLYIVPMILRIVIVVSAFLSQGFLGGILITVLLYPIFFICKHVIFDPLEIIILLSAYSKYCTEEEPEDSIFKGIVDSILESIGLADVSAGDEDEDEDEDEYEEDSEEEEQSPNKSVEATRAAESADELIDVEPEFDPFSLPLSDIPEVEETGPRFTAGSSAADRLRSLSQQLHDEVPETPTGGLAAATQRVPHIPMDEELDPSSFGGAATQLPVIPDEDDDGIAGAPSIEELAPVVKLTELLNGMSADAFNAELGSDDDTGVLGGDDIDFS